MIGHVFVEFDKRELSNKRRELLEQATLIIALGMIPLGILAIFVADGMSAPVRRLATAVRMMSDAHFNTRVPENTSGEIGILERGFNEMAEHIEEVHHSMQLRIEEATAQLAYQARHDALTGLINRREFEARLERALRSVQAGGAEFSVLFIDLDRFKPVNDACGHLAGDELLRQIAQLFQTRLRDEDALGRLGGDEFGIILYDCKLANALQIANDICILAGDYRFIWQDKVFAVGASIGATVVDRHVRRIKDILAAGDAPATRPRTRDATGCAPTSRKMATANASTTAIGPCASRKPWPSSACKSMPCRCGRSNPACRRGTWSRSVPACTSQDASRSCSRP